MTLRCTICSEYVFYDEKREKMTMILSCPKCRGKVEMLGSGRLAGEHPVHQGKTFSGAFGPYFYAYKNDSGKYFVFINDKLVTVEDPVIAE